MKTVGDVLSQILDIQSFQKAKSYSELFASWTEIAVKNGIAAEYTRIKELERETLLIEVDHPGWKQIIQTKQSRLLNDFRERFPSIEIKEIHLVLSRPANKEVNIPDKTEKVAAES
jgi:hypothetical protein